MPAPVANFTIVPSSGNPFLLAAFTDTSTNVPASWAWDFGDGGTSAAQNPSHVFAKAGTYTVSLTATNASGSSSTTKTVTVNPVLVGADMDTIYRGIEYLVRRSTGRSVWRKGGIQGQPTGPFATIFITMGQSLQNPVTENVENDPLPGTGEPFKQIPWGTQNLSCQVEFLRSAANDTAIQAANRLANALRLEERFWDLWMICGLVGAVNILDISAIFRADIEPRTRVSFSVNANLIDAPLADTNIYDIENQPVEIADVAADGTHIDANVAISNTGGVTPWPTT